jgi:hypothetical protein
MKGSQRQEMDACEAENEKNLLIEKVCCGSADRMCRLHKRCVVHGFRVTHYSPC